MILSNKKLLEEQDTTSSYEAMVFNDFTGLVMQLQVVNIRKVWLI